MIIIKKLEIEKFKGIKHSKLDKLGDLNILIGPNNCGKTNVLRAINKLSELEYGGAYGYPLCEICNKGLPQIDGNIIGYRFPYSRVESYLEKGKTKISFLLNKEWFNRFVPGAMQGQKKLLSSFINDETIFKDHVKEDLTFGSSDSGLYGEHFSVFASSDILEELKRSILFCPEARLEGYKDKNFGEFVKEKITRGAQYRRWIKFLRDIVDLKIIDYKNTEIVREVEGEEIVKSYKEQGSGVRSLVCLSADILFTDAKIVLIDEPELGLNPWPKQELLKFILGESRSKQIFMATHDPTFVNPTLLKNSNVAVFFYSAIGEEFVKIDLNESKEDPDTFAGYLPHTTALRDIHIYVEGSSDVYIFQVFLRRYVTKHFEKWAEVLNKIGIYHLAGDFWQHLLYTIPKPPYRCIVVLDGNKKEDAKAISEKYEKSTINSSKFEFCENMKAVEKTLKMKNKTPIYCLKEDCIEKLLGQSQCKSTQWKKKIDGPNVAEEMEKIPDEIEKIFDVILREILSTYHS